MWKMTAVSYTHLDVYKRQVEEWGLKENRICIQIVRNESGKMGNPVAHRSTSGSSGDACIQ